MSKIVHFDALDKVREIQSGFNEKYFFLVGTEREEANYSIDDEILFDLFVEKHEFFLDSIDDTNFSQIVGTSVQVCFDSIDDLLQGLRDDVDTNAAGIAANLVSINSNTAQIALNELNISTNASGIDTNQTNIGINTAAISALDGRVTVNEGDILTLQGQVSALIPITILTTAIDVSPAVPANLYAVDASGGDVTISLPAAPPDSSVVKISKRDSSNNKVIVNVVGGVVTIDGQTSVFTDNQYTTTGFQYSSTLGEWIIIG